MSATSPKSPGGSGDAGIAEAMVADVWMLADSKREIVAGITAALATARAEGAKAENEACLHSGGEHNRKRIAVAEAALASPSPSGAPATHKLVPIEPTEEMVRVGFVLALGTDDEQPSIADVYRAMIEAAPPSPEDTR